MMNCVPHNSQLLFSRGVGVETMINIRVLGLLDAIT
jgi:hypothetical protein